VCADGEQKPKQQCNRRRSGKRLNTVYR